MNENELFKTKDFYLTAFLKAKNLNIVKVMQEEKENEFYFCFIKNKDLTDFVEDYLLEHLKKSAESLN